MSVSEAALYRMTSAANVPAGHSLISNADVQRDGGNADVKAASGATLRAAIGNVWRSSSTIPRTSSSR